ncbi:branched-chain amino acid ABC transporter permease [Achromobacter sp. GG226]|nr:branched-chain amino acid ABC transporter permease [Verticiella sp. GG226]
MAAVGRAHTVRARLGALVAAVLLAAPLIAQDAFLLRFAAEILLVGAAVTSLTLLIGQGGLVSLGHGAVFGAAAYAAAIVAGHVSGDLTVMLLVGVLTGTLLALAMAAITLRTQGLFFLVLTLVVGQMVWELAFRWRDVTGGADGLRGFARLTLAGVPLHGPMALYLVTVGVALAAWAITRAFTRAPVGVALTGLRDQPLRMAALGYSVARLRAWAFATAGAVAGAAGAVYPFVNQYVGPNVVHWSQSATFIIMAVIGGIGSRVGGFVGAAVYLFVQTYVSSHTERWQLVIGLIFVAVVLFMPHGVAQALRLRGPRGATGKERA